MHPVPKPSSTRRNPSPRNTDPPRVGFGSRLSSCVKSPLWHLPRRDGPRFRKSLQGGLEKQLRASSTRPAENTEGIPASDRASRGPKGHSSADAHSQQRRRPAKAFMRPLACHCNVGRAVRGEARALQFPSGPARCDSGILPRVSLQLGGRGRGCVTNPPVALLRSGWESKPGREPSRSNEPSLEDSPGGSTSLYCPRRTCARQKKRLTNGACSFIRIRRQRRTEAGI